MRENLFYFVLIIANTAAIIWLTGMDMMIEDTEYGRSASTHYDWWHHALAGDAVEYHTDVVHPGFYRKRAYKNGPWLPVAIWPYDGKMIALCDGKEVDPASIWNFCCQHPISSETYQHALETGRWPDVDENVSREKPHDDDGVEGFERQLDELKIGLPGYTSGIRDDDHAAQAQSLRSAFNDIARHAKKEHDAEKQPHLLECQRVDRKWRDIIQDAKDQAARIARALSAYATEKARKARDDRINEPQETKITPGEGRAATIRDVKVITEIVDLQMLMLWLYANYPSCQEMVARLAGHALNDGADVPGIRWEIEKRVR